MAPRKYELEFVATFRRRVEVDTEEEAQAILNAATIGDVYENPDWNIDPHEFEKTIVDSWDADEDDPDEQPTTDFVYYDTDGTIVEPVDDVDVDDEQEGGAA